MNRKPGFWLGMISVIFALVAIAFYMLNTKTEYFRSYGVDWMLVILLIGGICLAVCCMLMKRNIIKDLLYLISGCMFMASFAILLGDRVNEAAFIMTFQKNAETVADLTSAIVSLSCILAAWVVWIIGSFMESRK